MAQRPSLWAVFTQLGDIHRLLSDPDMSSLRLVLNPEKAQPGPGGR